MINIFISHPTPHNRKQQRFLELIEAQLMSHGLNPTNLGKQNWNYKSPMKPISDLMRTCKGAIIIGLERYHSYIGYEKEKIESIHRYVSTPWIHIEAGMAYQTGLPLLILKEKKLVAEGILDPNISEYFVFEFEIEKMQKELAANLKQVIASWNDSFNLKQTVDSTA
jgi:hypothetical protein